MTDSVLQDDGSIAAATLDQLFRRSAIRDPDAVALADPPDKMTVIGGEARILTYAETDRIVWRLARRLRAFGLPPGTAVAFQLPNTVESIITILAVARAGLVAAPLPLLWRQAEIVTALTQIDAKVLIGATRVTGLDPFAVLMNTAARLFTIRHVCTFGPGTSPDAIDLGDVFDTNTDNPDSLSSGYAQSGDDPVVVTFDITPEGPRPVRRTHRELQAGGLGWFVPAKISKGSGLLSATPVTSFAGLSTTLMGWLMSGGTLVLHHPFDAACFEHQRQAWPCQTLILPGPLALRMGESLMADTALVVALWSAPERLAQSERWQAATRLLDIAIFGETALYAADRLPDGRPGSINPGRSGPGPGTLQALRAPHGTLALRGAMIPDALRQSDLSPRRTGDRERWADTGLPCRLDPATGVLSVQSSSPGLVQIGGYRLAKAQLDRLSPHAILIAVPDALNGRRLAGKLTNIEILAELEKNGVNSLIFNAFTRKDPIKTSLIDR